MKVLITSRSFGAVSDEPLRILTEAGFDVEFYNGEFDMDTFAKVIADKDVLIIGGHEFPSSIMRNCSELKLICKHGAGVDNIDLKAAKEMGIRVCNAPGTNANAVADLTFGLILELSRKISKGIDQADEGIWKPVIGRDVCYKTLGLIGFGAIAKNVARRAHGFGMNVMARDPYVDAVENEFSSYVKLVDKSELLAESDIISLHLPLNDETRYCIDRDELNLTKADAILINTSRGGIVNEGAVLSALKDGRLAGAAFDVLEDEPLRKNNPLLGRDDVIITPHMGMYSVEAINAVSMICARNAANFANGEDLAHELHYI